MTEVQNAWAAGLFDGEGCITPQQGDWCLQLRMNDKDVVDRFAEWAGHGIVHEEAGVGNRQTSYRWRICKAAVVHRLLNAMLPYFGNRRANRSREALASLESNKAHLIYSNHGDMELSC